MNNKSNSADEDFRVVALHRMLELTALLHQDSTRSLAHDGLTPSRAALLWQLRARGPSTQRVLAEVLGVTPRNITQLVDALEATGFVTREAHPTDRRATLVTFTEQGTTAVEAIDRQQDEFVSQLFDAMPDRQVRALLKGVEDVVGRLRELGLTYQPAEQAP